MEIDVLVAMAIGMSLDDLLNLYSLQFPLTQQYEDDTWYDNSGSIVFTSSRGLSQVGVNRTCWEENKYKSEIIKKIEVNYTKNKRVIEKKYLSPFVKGNRINEYKEIWAEFENRFVEK